MLDSAGAIWTVAAMGSLRLLTLSTGVIAVTLDLPLSTLLTGKSGSASFAGRCGAA